MRFAAITSAIFAIGAIATPALVEKDCDDVCMTYDQAMVVANNFKHLIADYSDAYADKVLTVDFTDYSDSVDELINNGCLNGPATLGEPTFKGRAAFEKGQGSQPAIPFEILQMWYSCEGPVVIRWRSAMTPEIVTGNIVMETARNTGAGKSEQPWLIKTVYSEFNSGAWMVNLGIITPQNCSASAAPAKGKRSPALGRML